MNWRKDTKGGGHDIIKVLVSQSPAVRHSAEDLRHDSLCPGQDLKLKPTTCKSNPYHFWPLAKCKDFKWDTMSVPQYLLLLQTKNTICVQNSHTHMWHDDSEELLRLLTFLGKLWHFMAAHFLPDTKASQVHTLSVTKATTSWADKFTVSGSNIKKVEENQQLKANKPYSMGSYCFTLLVDILQRKESRYNRASEIYEQITIMIITELLC